MNILAWDPGASGGFAWMDKFGVQTESRSKLDGNQSLNQFLYSHLRAGGMFVYESQTYCAGVRVSAFSMGNFGQGTGEVVGAVTMLNSLLQMNSYKKILVIGVTPQAWQSRLGLVKDKKTKKPKLSHNACAKHKQEWEMKCREIDAINAPISRDWKRRLQEEAARLYPNIKVTMAKADALLILQYAIKFLVPCEEKEFK